MANAKARYKNSEGQELELALDIDLRSQTINEAKISGALAFEYNQEWKEIEEKILGRSLSEALAIKRQSLKHEFSPQGKKSLGSLSLWLLHRAIENYLGRSAVLAESAERLCLCFGVRLEDIRKEVIARPDYELKHLIAETFATSACGSCLGPIMQSLEDLRLQHGKIKGRFDKEGRWIKIKGLFPGELVLLLDDYKNEWMQREALNDQFQIEIVGIEGVNLQMSVKAKDPHRALDEERAVRILEALSEYFKSKTGVLFFLHLLA